DRLIFRIRVKPFLEKYFAFSETQTMLMVRHPAPHREGRSGSSRVLGAGSDGRVGVRRRSTLARTAKARGPDLPTLGSTLRAQKPGGTVAKTPGHRGERAISRKPLRRECRHVRRTCRDLRACFLPFLHAKLRVRFGIRHSLHPLSREGHVGKARTRLRRGNAAPCSLKCESETGCHRCRRGRRMGAGASFPARPFVTQPEEDPMYA